MPDSFELKASHLPSGEKSWLVFGKGRLGYRDRLSIVQQTEGRKDCRRRSRRRSHLARTPGTVHPWTQSSGHSSVDVSSRGISVPVEIFFSKMSLFPLALGREQDSQPIGSPDDVPVGAERWIERESGLGLTLRVDQPDIVTGVVGISLRRCDLFPIGGEVEVRRVKTRAPRSPTLLACSIEPDELAPDSRAPAGKVDQPSILGHVESSLTIQHVVGDLVGYRHGFSGERKPCSRRTAGQRVFPRGGTANAPCRHTPPSTARRRASRHLSSRACRRRWHGSIAEATKPDRGSGDRPGESAEAGVTFPAVIRRAY